MSVIYPYYELYGAEIMLGLAVVSLILLVLVLAQQAQLGRLRQRYQAAMRGVEGGDIEPLLIRLQAAADGHEERLEGLEARSTTLEKTVATHAGRVGIVRFNPFDDSGGDQSFSIAWVDEARNGVVISSLHSRAGVRVYAKPVVKGGSPYNLSEEETRAIAGARE